MPISVKKSIYERSGEEQSLFCLIAEMCIESALILIQISQILESVLFFVILCITYGNDSLSCHRSLSIRGGTLLGALASFLTKTRNETRRDPYSSFFTPLVCDGVLNQSLQPTTK